MNNIDQKTWKQSLQQKEKRRIKKDELRMRYEAFVGACVDIYGRIIAHTNTVNADLQKVTAACIDASLQLQGLRKIFNEGMMELSKRYKCQVIQLDEIKLKRLTDKYKVNRKVADEDASVESDGDEELAGLMMR